MTFSVEISCTSMLTLYMYNQFLLKVIGFDFITSKDSLYIILYYFLLNLHRGCKHVLFHCQALYSYADFPFFVSPQIWFGYDISTLEDNSFKVHVLGVVLNVVICNFCVSVAVGNKYCGLGTIALKVYHKESVPIQ